MDDKDKIINKLVEDNLILIGVGLELLQRDVERLIDQVQESKLRIAEMKNRNQ